MERAMLKGAKLFDIFWKEVIHIVVYILNKGILRTHSDKTTYELWRGRPASVKYFRIFDRKCYIKRNENNPRKFDARIDGGILLGYSPHNKAYICFNLIISKIETSVDVAMDDESLESTFARIKEEDDGPEMEQTQVSQNEEKLEETQQEQ